MLALMGITVDVARFYFAWVNLEASTRDAAQYIASDPALNSTGGYYDSTDATNYCGASWTTCTTQPSADAVTVLHNETGKTFTANATQTTCTTAKVWAILQAPDTTVSHGGAAGNPLAEVKVTACEPFRTIIAYPIISTGGTWILRTERTVKTIVGR